VKIGDDDDGMFVDGMFVDGMFVDGMFVDGKREKVMGVCGRVLLGILHVGSSDFSIARVGKGKRSLLARTRTDSSMTGAASRRALGR